MLKKIIKRILGVGHVKKSDIRQIRFMIGQHIAKVEKHNYNNQKSLHDFEFQVFSQWGDDGIIQFLVNSIDISNKYFIEFGVENYLESNTRFLLMNNNWSGLVMDGSSENIDLIKKDTIYWKYDLRAIEKFLTAENINQTISDNCDLKEIGLLHIDIDGCDYWLWKAIDEVTPDIVIVEYNSVLGDKRSISVPYDPAFIRAEKHYSHLYAGCSLQALIDLSSAKGYSFVGVNSNGNNAYFVLNEKMKNLRALTIQEGFVDSKFRESRDESGNLTYLSSSDRVNEIKGLEVINTLTGKKEFI